MGNKQFELTNHLGNVLAVISNKKLARGSGSTVDYYDAELLSATDYYPFGMQMPGRVFNGGGYRFGMNGQEKVDEISGSGNHYTAPFWEYDPRIGRRWNIDPILKRYESSYATFANNPIGITDRLGNDTVLYTQNSGWKLNAFTKKGGDPRNIIYTVNELASNYNAKDPWATARVLLYEVGSKVKDPSVKKGITGKSLPSNHPLSFNAETGKGGTLAGQPVFEADLYDMTGTFMKVLRDGNSHFLPTKTGPWKYWFYTQVTDNGPYDTKSTKRSNTSDVPVFAVTYIGEWTLWGGTLRRYDDYGNISYRYWGRLYGFSEKYLLQKSDDNQDTMNGTTTTGVGDEPRDKYSIMMGFKLYNREH
ncbi:hypothetical protein COR50_20625 [Chitinophaga caeni]|uniref:Bacterial toxin 44 domain-containing protein n=1 Tax=Chitinophaga caeni TaxID=2029983 RepID=A0A291QZL7_9BACT|nr:hypothetical protein COR50_20625 [Chitinophaga caeni]